MKNLKHEKQGRMEKELIIKYKKGIRKLKSKSIGDIKPNYSECSSREENSCTRLQAYSDGESENQKEILEETRTRIAYSLKKYVEHPYRLNLTTFRPLLCPMPSCDLSLCPSSLLFHLLQCHRNLPSTLLELSGDVASFDVYNQICQLEPLVPAPVHLLKVNDGLYPEFPVLLHMCWLSEEKAPALTSERWLAAWLSSLYLVPMWFRLQFVAYSPLETSIAYVCRTTETQNLMNPQIISESNFVMLVQEKSLARLYSNELSLYVEVNTYDSNPPADDFLQITD